MSDTQNTPTPAPSPNGDNGRATGGRFAKGNAGGPGNPYGAKVAALRAALMDAVTPDTMARIAAALVKQAEAGDIAAARELLQRCLGAPQAIDLISRVEELEAAQREGQR
jgi:hypothetical protein